MTEQKRMVSIEAGLLDSLIDFYDIMVALDYQSEALDYLFDIDNETGEQNISDWARLTVACDFLREGRDKLNSLQATGSDSDSAEPRYVVESWLSADFSDQPIVFKVRSTQDNSFVDGVYRHSDEAQTVADKLNAGIPYEGARFTVAESRDVNKRPVWHVYDNKLKRPNLGIYATEADAESAADKLNGGA